jgi:hypothetical protein
MLKASSSRSRLNWPTRRRKVAANGSNVTGLRPQDDEVVKAKKWKSLLESGKSEKMGFRSHQLGYENQTGNLRRILIRGVETRSRGRE